MDYTVIIVIVNDMIVLTMVSALVLPTLVLILKRPGSFHVKLTGAILPSQILIKVLPIHVTSNLRYS